MRGFGGSRELSCRMAIFGQPSKGKGYCNDPTIGSYSHYHLSSNGIPSGNPRWYGPGYLVYKYLVNLGQGLEHSRVVLGTLQGRVTFRE